MATGGAVLTPINLQYDKLVIWLKHFQIFVQGHHLKVELKSAFLSYCGTDCFHLLVNLVAPSKLTDSNIRFTFKSSSDPTQTNIRELLLSHLRPKRILHCERVNFFNLRQVSEMSISQYVAQLRECASSCEFGVMLEDLLLTQFIVGVRNSHVQRQLLTNEKLTLELAIQICLINEEAVKMNVDHYVENVSAMVVSHLLTGESPFL
jgi:hypothetical protein